MSHPRIPLVDLNWQHVVIADAVRAGFERVLTSTAFINGPDVGLFEQEFASYTGVEHCVGVANGTDAVELALRAVGVGPGDRVVVPANTFFASAEAVVRSGAVPVFVDCDPEYQLIDVDAALALAPEAKAILAVDLFGQLAPMRQLANGLEGTNCVLVEDAAQSQGATRGSDSMGSIATVAATSFYPGKNLGCYGDGGAVLTRNAELAGAVRLFADHGSRVRYVHEVAGANSRLDTLQAVVLREKLRHLTDWNNLRRAAAEYYIEALAECPGVQVPGSVAVAEDAWHLFVVRVKERDQVLEAMHEAGIGAGIHYPIPVPFQPAFRHAGYVAGDFPHAEAASAEILSLPIYPGITHEQQDRVVAVVVAASGGV